MSGDGPEVLEQALAEARARGRQAAARILRGGDMLTPDAFARAVGVSRTALEPKRRTGQVPGLPSGGQAVLVAAEGVAWGLR